MEHEPQIEQPGMPLANTIISDDRLREFQDAYKQDFGEDISREDAREMLSRLVMLYEMLARPIVTDQEDILSDCVIRHTTAFVVRCARDAYGNSPTPLRGRIEHRSVHAAS